MTYSEIDCQATSCKSLLVLESLEVAEIWFAAPNSLYYVTAQKMNFSMKDSFSKCDEICRKLRILSDLLKKSLMENFIFLCSTSRSFYLYNYVDGYVHIALEQANPIILEPLMAVEVVAPNETQVSEIFQIIVVNKEIIHLGLM